MTGHTYTITLSDGTLVQVTSTRSLAQQARYIHLCKLFNCWELPPVRNERTEADYDAWKHACALRDHAADDVLLYGGAGWDDRNVGY